MFKPFIFFKSSNCFYFFLISVISLSIIFLPIQIVSTIANRYDDKRFVELLIISLNLIVFLTSKSLSTSVISIFNSLTKRYIYSLQLILLLTLFSVFLSYNLKSAAQESSLYLALFFLFLSISCIARSNSTVLQHTFCLAFIIGSFIYQVQFFSAYLASFIENIPLQWPDPFRGFSNIRFFNQYQIWSIPLISLPILLYPSLDKRLLYSLKIIAIGWAVLLFTSGSRGAVASVSISIILSFIIFRNHAKPLLKLNSILLLAGAFGYLLLFKLFPWALDNEVTLGWKPIAQFASSSARIELWQFAIQYIIDNPWLGIGPMHYAYYPGPGLAHPHNSILQWACEMGIPSALILIFLVFSSLIAWVKKFYRLQEQNKLTVPTHLWIALFCSMSSGLIYSLVSGVIVMPLSQIMMALIAGWMLGVYFQNQESPPTSKIQVLGFKLLASITLITLVYTVLPGLLPRLSSYANLPYQNYTVHSPRFWQIGGVPH